MPSNLVLTGGPLHDFDATTAVLVELLADAGVESTVVADPHEALARIGTAGSGWDLVTVNALHWEMAAERFAPLRHRWACTLEAGETGGLDRWVRSGGALLALHTAVICFDADPRWRACLGASWDWGRSTHPPVGPALVSVTDAGRRHPVTGGVDGIRTTDEIYGFLDLDADVEPLLTSRHGGVEHPVVWARRHGRGRVVVDLLGHDASAMAEPTHAELLRRAARWLTDDTTTTDGAAP